jgi:hypothetical protein
MSLDLNSKTIHTRSVCTCKQVFWARLSMMHVALLSPSGMSILHTASINPTIGSHRHLECVFSRNMDNRRESEAQGIQQSNHEDVDGQ